MEVIPLTLALSLLLSLTFIALFVREFSRPHRAGAAHDSLRPLEPELKIPACGPGCAACRRSCENDRAHVVRRQPSA